MLRLSNTRRRYTGVSSKHNFVFKLCYQWTALLLVAFSFVVTCRILFGSSFSCLSEFDRQFINSKCYANVYTVPVKENDSSRPRITEDSKRYLSYYPWVNLLFLVHAFFFCLPHLLWKSYEGGYMDRLTAGFLEKEVKRSEDVSHLAKQAAAVIGHYGKYTLAYIIFEVCNFVVSLALSLWLIYFFQVVSASGERPTWSAFQDFYFPQDGKCEFALIGRSGDTQRHGAACTLPLNPLYMKMFLFLRAWYMLLTVLCTLVPIYRAVLLVPQARLLVIKMSSPFSARPALESMFRFRSYSDWFFLSELQKVLTDFEFSQLLSEIDSHVGGKHSFEDAAAHNLKAMPCNNGL